MAQKKEVAGQQKLKNAKEQKEKRTIWQENIELKKTIKGYQKELAELRTANICLLKKLQEKDNG